MESRPVGRARHGPACLLASQVTGAGVARACRAIACSHIVSCRRRNKDTIVPYRKSAPWNSAPACEQTLADDTTPGSGAG
eukprot:gene21245-biopygen1097